MAFKITVWFILTLMSTLWLGWYGLNTKEKVAIDNIGRYTEETPNTVCRGGFVTFESYFTRTRSM